MTDLEKELVEKLAIEEQRPFYGATQDIADMPIEVARKRVEVMFMPLIHSHTQALVAAAYAACADAASQDAQVIVTSLGNMESGDATGEELDRAMKAAMNIRPRLCKLTPADAVRELERRDELVRADTIMRFRKVLDRLDIHGYYNEMQREFGCDEASLTKPAPVEKKKENVDEHD